MIGKLFHPAEAQGYVRIQLDALRVGMYVWLKCAWYKHPFPTNRFMLVSQKQIETIRGLRPATVYVHPGLSQMEDEAPPVSPDLSLMAQRVVEAHPAPTKMTKERLTAANQQYADTLRQGAGALRKILDGHEDGGRAAESIVDRFLEQLGMSEAAVGLAQVMHLKSMNRAQAAHG